MDKLINYLDCINDHCNSFISYIDHCFFISEISKEDIFSNDELLNKIFNITDSKQQHNAELIELKGFEYPIKNFIKENMYSSFKDYVSFNIKNESDKVKLMKGLGLKYRKNPISIEKHIQELDNNYNCYNDVTNNFFNMLVNYSGIPQKTFFIKSDPNFHVACFSEDILLEYNDKYISLSFSIDD